MQLSSYSRANTDTLKTREDRYYITKIQIRKIVEKDIKFDSLQKRFEQMIRLQKDVIQPSQVQTKQAFTLSDAEINNLQKIVIIDKKIIKNQGIKNIWLKIRLPLSFVTAFYLGNVFAQKGVNITF